ncbi:SDR family NAD(P)-dependent oxidoreductase [Companilactobacillus nuruki]|uniref:Oxidoreductase n=1 Tax=Companilactobacillus nuruki TaxID=1993540 RepID=A0A2N7AVT0_9LACO|nr:SDR family oxidoreductase [Companilactobacillus nuruki]PMD72298.1 oxidoreductase [Companilactobacillus nuruki]
MTKNILITGGTSGIGQAAVELFVNEGWNVATIGRNPEKTTKFAENHPGVQAFIADMSKVDDIKRVMTEISSKMDHLDAFFANAGFGIFKPFSEITENDFDKQVDLNYKGTFFSIQEATKLMSKGGSIVINTSWTYHRGLKTSTLYSSSKSAVAYLTKSLALELGEKGIRVNAVSPGYTNSAQFNEKSIEVDRLAAMISRVPLHRFADASEIANVVEFLSSNKSSYINGQDIVIDGGMTVTHAEPEVRI